MAERVDDVVPSDPPPTPEESGRRAPRWFLWTVGLVLAAWIAVLAGIPAVFVFGPLLAWTIFQVGLATFNSFDAGAAYIPDAPPVAVDVRQERITYWCDGCGAEMLLLIRGTPMPPRHCGERMHPRVEIARRLPPSIER